MIPAGFETVGPFSLSFCPGEKDRFGVCLGQIVMIVNSF